MTFALVVGPAAAAEEARPEEADVVQESQDPTADTVNPASTEAGGATEKATFAAGCFWGVEAAFRRVSGVRATTVGYLGGTTPDPTYRDVCTGKTGHAEVVEVEFDPAQVTYDELLSIFWQSHDPTTLNRQGPDVGTQYRSAVFFHTPEQETAARASKAALQARSSRPVVTEITPASPFYPAEEYHQRYLEKRGLATCAIQP